MASGRDPRTVRRAFVLIGTTVAALLCAASPVGAATATPTADAKFELHEHGFLVTVETEAREEKVVLTLYRHGQVAAYQAGATTGEDWVKARFGRFGELDYTFTPDPGSGGCRGSDEGTFSGTFTFTGERGFVHFEADHAHGTFTAEPPDCKEESGPRLPSPHFRSAGVTLRRAAKREEEVTLDAHSSHLPFRVLLVFTTEYKGRPVVLFNAFREEKLEGMLIARGVQTSAGLGSFDWDLDAGTARLDPPAPLLGTAVMRPRRHGPPAWSGSLRAPVLGAAPIRLAGPGIVAHLGAGSPLD